jgi:predicted dehydrogenase
MTTSTLHVGVIGLQGYGNSYFQVFKQRSDVRELGVCDTNTEALAACAAAYDIPHTFTDYRELLALQELDAVFIATPHFLHHPMTMEALRAGKHVFCEKPLAITSSDADEMGRTARSVGKMLSCHYNQRVAFPTRLIRQVMSKALLGEVYQINASWMARWTGFMFDAETTWRQSMAKSGGGIFIGRGSHLIDAVLYALGFPQVRSIYATMSNRLTGYEVDDFASANLQLKGGTTINLQCSYVAHAPDYGEKMEYELFGTKGGLLYRRLDGGEPVIKIGGCRLPTKEWRDYSAQVDVDGIQNEPVRGLIDDFLDAIKTGRAPLVSAEEAAFVTRILEAGYASARSGQIVTLPPNSMN